MLVSSLLAEAALAIQLDGRHYDSYRHSALTDLRHNPQERFHFDPMGPVHTMASHEQNCNPLTRADRTH
jgi:hypothetical protein